ncbi:MAG: hypothetical protein M3460_30080 [Actinomycetota bacterium]|nr:hypothetical protein [Actinomycetota bacterium]
MTRLTRRVEAVQWANQIVVTRRVELFTQVAPKLNQLLCFATFVGRWKEIRPEQAVALKRDLDEIMYSNRVLFSDELFGAYQAFMATLFDMYASTDADAPLRAQIATVLGNRRNLAWWQESMTSCFSDTNSSTIDEVKAAYDTLGQQFRADLCVTHTVQPLLITPRPPERQRFRPAVRKTPAGVSPATTPGPR